MKIYTKTGDNGTTSLLGGERVAKNDLRMEICGTLDEANAAIGVALAHIYNYIKSQGFVQSILMEGIEPVTSSLGRIQHNLFDLGAEIATPSDKRHTLDSLRKMQSSWEELTKELESEIDKMEETLPSLENFILPGGHISSAHIHLARTITRRAERLLSSGNFESCLHAYVNRLSDFLFVAARFSNNVFAWNDIPYNKK